MGSGAGLAIIAGGLARRLGAVCLRIDTLEHSLAASGAIILANLGSGGYLAAAVLATDNLNNDLTVVVDLVNPFVVTRDIWRRAAGEAGTECLGLKYSALIFANTDGGWRSGDPTYLASRLLPGARWRNGSITLGWTSTCDWIRVF